MLFYLIRNGFSTFLKSNAGSELCCIKYCSKISNNSKPLESNGNNEAQKDLKLPDEPTTCCMSGCTCCVWLKYAEELSAHFKDGGERAIKEINENISDPNIKAYLLHELRMRKKT